jgi:xanthine dehydrogenase iron-sulfur cluster and FAD-binding subunit A
VKPGPFVHHAPTTVDEAVAVLGEVGHDGKVLAGGQSLIPVLSMRLATPGHLVDINGVAGLDAVHVTDTAVRIGALVRHAGLEQHDGAATALPLLRQALRNVAHPAIRNRGTTVGSIAHADPAGEMPSVLVLTDGVVEAVGPGGRREIAATDFFLGPLETSLADDELVEAVRFTRFGPGTRTAFLESSRRHGDYALAGVAVAVDVADGVVVGARAGFVSVTPVPSVLDLTPVLGGRDAGAPVPDEVTDAVREFVDPEGDIHATADYRRMLAAELTRRALATADPPDTRSRPGTHHRPGVRRMSEQTTDTPPEQLLNISLRVNGVTRTASAPARRLLSDFLRHDLGLTGTHVGCEHGVCGACTVLVDGQPMRACLMFAVSAQRHEVTTIEGIGNDPENLSPVQQAFTECHALQCGFCTPGFVTTITAYLEDNPDPTPEQAREAISGNLCRCTGYQNIVSAVCRAAEIRRDRADRTEIDQLVDLGTTDGEGEGSA